MTIPRIICILISVFSYHLNAYSNDMIEIEDIWLTQNIHVTGDTLCQDGQSIYFKSRNACEEATPDWNCLQSLKISPIHFIEKVEIPNGQSITHFYNIKMTYDYLRYELTSFYPIKNYDLVESRQVTIPVCDKMEKKKPLKFRKIRKASQSEFSFIYGLIKSGVSVLNTPYGSLSEMAENLKNINIKDSERSVPKLKSPLCNSDLDYNDIDHKASGEWSGNGIQIASLKEWQENSKDLGVVLKKDQNMKSIFEFYCLKEKIHEL